MNGRTRALGVFPSPLPERASIWAGLAPVCRPTPSRICSRCCQPFPLVGIQHVRSASGGSFVLLFHPSARQSRTRRWFGLAPLRLAILTAAPRQGGPACQLEGTDKETRKRIQQTLPGEATLSASASSLINMPVSPEGMSVKWSATVTSHSSGSSCFCSTGELGWSCGTSFRFVLFTIPLVVDDFVVVV